MSEKVRIGIVGLNLGQWHVETIAEMDDAMVAAVAENNPSRLGQPLEDYARSIGARAYTDGIEMMEREELDAVNLWA